jgi:hypothetical protein
VKPTDKLCRAVTAALRLEPALATAYLLVEIVGSTVLLDGAVDDVAAALLAEEVVCAVPGVARVRSRLIIRPDLGAEGEAKQTEFGDKSRARAATGEYFWALPP